LKKIHDSDEYKVIGLIKFYSSTIERRETTPKITFIAVDLNEEMTNAM
jgi:hypothetical protein